MSICEHYFYDKQTLSLHKVISSGKSTPLQLVHNSDVCNPIPIWSMGGALYFVKLIDDFSQKVWVYSLKSKDEVLLVFQRFLTLLESQIEKIFKCLRFDNGAKYVSKSFQ